jgi:hypothetical protein
MADADERAQSQAEGADKRADGFTRRLLVADVRELGHGRFETRRVFLLDEPGLSASDDEDGAPRITMTVERACRAAGVRPLVMEWVRKIEATLRRNEGPPKRKGPWGAGRWSAYAGLMEERAEVDRGIMAHITSVDPDKITAGEVDEVIMELVDEATSAMILADVVRPGGPSKDRGWTL